MSLTAGSRLGPYEVLGVIGAGGMGEVYRARDTTLHREVAIKVLPAAVAGNPETARALRARSADVGRAEPSEYRHGLRIRRTSGAGV